MDAATPASRIRTPDQRLRVFVSSTLRELAAERRVVREAVERIGAAPVMFELGARPHPPRELYRAYLQQSDIFVGLYWERYGWVAPGETVSGLEDEYNLAPPDMPRLIYIKESSGARDPRLSELLERIKTDDAASYTSFREAEDLERLVVADLAVLLAERFDAARARPAPAQPHPAPSSQRDELRTLPRPLTRLFGREEETQEIARRLQSDDVRLLTLVGPGGIGKTRLAIDAARRAAPAFPDGAVFVPLAPVDDPALVPGAIAQALGVRDTGDRPLTALLLTALRDRRVLLVLDNFEQVLDAGSVVTTLLEGAPGLTVLVTSRTLLRVSGEHAVEVPPLPLPDPQHDGQHDGNAVAPSVALFADRARAVKPDFELDEGNVRDVEAVVARLDGVPLAIELAAARIRLLSPGSLLERLDRRLAVLVGGARDLPARQQTVRSTIEWSTRLLREEERRLLWRLGVFSGRFSLSAVEAVAEGAADVLDLLEALVDASLVRQQDRDGRTYFALLATVREYALDQLEQRREIEAVRDKHAHYYAEWARRLGRALNERGQMERLAELSDERDDLRSAVRTLLDAGDLDPVAELAWSLYRYWWLGSQFGEVGGWMREALSSGGPASDRTRAIALCLRAIVGFRQRPGGELIRDLTESLDLFTRIGSQEGEAIVLEFLAFASMVGGRPDRAAAAANLERSAQLAALDRGHWGEVMSHVTLGRLRLLQRSEHEALAEFEAARQAAERQDDQLTLPLALHHLGWTQLRLGRVDDAAELFGETLDRSARLEHDLGIAYALEGFSGVALRRHDPEQAGLFSGAAEVVRERAGIVSITDSVFSAPLFDELRDGHEDELFERGHSTGRTLPRPEVLARTRGLISERGSGDLGT